jgi:ubiquinone/menaquinone biosynthesis C-methylase UbiE
MGLEEVRKVYERLGRDDPLYAVLTRHSLRGGRWDPEEFFETGRREIAGLLEYVASLPWELPRGAALDFGCGVGRLSQALAAEFDEVVGVDIASSMIAAAERFDRHPGRVRYLVNTSGDLRLLESDTFDLVYSSITLQHIPPEHQASYIREFVRVLRPGGLAIFQAHNGPRIEPGTPRAWLYTLRRQHLRRFWRRLRLRPAYEMHFIARSRVEQLVLMSGGRMVDVTDLSRGRPGRSLRYCVTR